MRNSTEKRMRKPLRKPVEKPMRKPVRKIMRKPVRQSIKTKLAHRSSIAPLRDQPTLHPLARSTPQIPCWKLIGIPMTYRITRYGLSGTMRIVKQGSGPVIAEKRSSTANAPTVTVAFARAAGSVLSEVVSAAPKLFRCAVKIKSVGYAPSVIQRKKRSR